MPNTIHAADELPAERSAIAPVTLLGAAHHWAERAKAAEAIVEDCQRTVRRYRIVLIVAVVASIANWGIVLWVLG